MNRRAHADAQPKTVPTAARPGEPVIPPALLSVERRPFETFPHFGVMRVGMVVVQLHMNRREWLRSAPYHAPSYAERMAAVVQQTLLLADRHQWTFDLLAFPAGMLNFYASHNPGRSLIEAPGLNPMLSTLRMVRGCIQSIVLGINVWEKGGGPAHIRPQGPTWRHLLAADGGGIVHLIDASESGRNAEESSHGEQLVSLAGRRVRLSLDHPLTDPLPPEQERIDADVWINPLSYNHPGGGPSAGSWPVSRVERRMKHELHPIILPHFRRSRLDGPFWFAGHPERSRPHRWQPVDEAWLSFQGGRVQLLSFDIPGTAQG